MPSPFPGMDPYLEQEAFWPTFHQHLMNTLFQAVVPSLLERYRARVVERTYTLEQVLFTSVTREERHEPFLEIRLRSDGKLVTMIDAASPANKTTALGRQMFLDKRQEAVRAKANVVELDLVLQGQGLHDFTKENLPAWDYNVVVARTPRPDQFELYTATLEKRLPRFRLPLAGDDRDSVVDLQAVLNRAYDQAGLAPKIDYARDPATRLSDEQKLFIDQRLREQKLRT